MTLDMTNWIAFLVGVFMVVVGIVVWAGKRIELVHGDDSSKVKTEDIPAYSRLLGIGLLLVGAAALSYAVLAAFEGIAVFIPWTVASAIIVCAVVVIFIGHKKYYGGMY